MDRQPCERQADEGRRKWVVEREVEVEPATRTDRGIRVVAREERLRGAVELVEVDADVRPTDAVYQSEYTAQRSTVTITTAIRLDDIRTTLALYDRLSQAMSGWLTAGNADDRPHSTALGPASG